MDDSRNSHRSHAIIAALRWSGWPAAVATLFFAGQAGATDYVVSDQASCEAFLAGIGAPDEVTKWSSDLCYVFGGELPETDRLFIQGVAGLRPQSGTFTNRGEISIAATGSGAGFYGAGTFVNEGTVHVVSADQPRNFATIHNYGMFTTDVDFYNNGTFTNDCGGTVNGTIAGANPVTKSPGPVPCDYVVKDEASCEAFLLGIGAPDADFQWASGLCYVFGGELPETDRLFIQGEAGLRPQSGTFTNRGEISISATGNGAGFYGAGTFVNEGTVHIVSAYQPRNFSMMRNSGTFTTDVDFYNNGTFTNDCGATINGAIIGFNPVTKTPNEFPCGEAADPAGVTSSDALVVLKAAVGTAECLDCVCDADASGKITAGDSLAVLRRAVGQGVDLRCPCCEAATTTTTMPL